MNQIEKHGDVTLQDEDLTFAHYMNRIGKFKNITPSVKMVAVKMLEVGTGWLPILCKPRGLSYKGCW